VAVSTRIALAQLDTTVGDVAGNGALVREWAARAEQDGAKLALFPELTLSGYPPEDLLLKRHFLDSVERELASLAGDVRLPVLVGFPERRGDLVHNAAALLRDGRIEAVYRKQRLPNYAVFDEERYFAAGSEALVFELDGLPLAVTICEDVWHPGGAGAAGADAGAQIVLNLSASPYHRGKGRARQQEVLAPRAAEYGVPVGMCNLVGGQDELVFDGQSMVVSPAGAAVAAARAFEPQLLAVEAPSGEGPRADALSEPEEIYRALVLGLRDYVAKNGFERVVLGLSGGIDSALVALIAVDALGPERVTCVVMPSRYSSGETQSDARAIAAGLGTDVVEVAIEEMFTAFERALAPRFDGRPPDIAEENVQARIRGTLVMALSNKFGWLVLTTGNKSEMSVGYATLYGDMAGGFAVIKDVFKTTVYELVRWRNRRPGSASPVPESVLTRAPSAELRENQTDQDSLPPYEALDAILAAYVEEDLGIEEIVDRGHDRAEVARVVRLVDAAEYKRRQAPPGVRISVKAFGRDRRMPITNRFRG
jgi:NAD+ synthase (glutamine-hydrolysing)